MQVRGQYSFAAGESSRVRADRATIRNFAELTVARRRRAVAESRVGEDATGLIIFATDGDVLEGAADVFAFRNRDRGAEQVGGDHQLQQLWAAVDLRCDQSLQYTRAL